MALVEHFRRMLAYEVWAGRRVVESLRTAEALMGDAVGPGGGATQGTVAIFRRACGIWAHVQMARHEWLSRLGHVQRRPWVMFPDWSVDECERDMTRLDAAWDAYLARVREDELARAIEYRATDGTPYSSLPGDVLTHVFTHSTYHRGQVAMLVKQCGGTPASTDFVAYSRQAGVSKQ